MKLSVVILNYNVSKFLYACLQSVQESLEHIDSEIIVIDNNSEDDSCQMVRDHFPNAILISNASNLGFSKGNNIGVNAASGEYICILNPDTIVAEDTFSIILKYAESKEHLGAIGCRLIDGTGAYLPESKRHIPTPSVALKKILGISKSYYFNELAEEKSGEVEVLVGAFMLMKREVYLNLGGFDEDYFMYGEDIDLSFRLLKSGFRNYYCGHTSIIHFKGESTFKDKKYANRFYGAMQIFYQKHFKSNALAAALVKLGIKSAHIVRPKESRSEILFQKVLYLSDSTSRIDEGFHYEVTRVKSITNPEPMSLIIFDASFISYKALIEHMSSNYGKRELYYRIQPKMVNFILGSDSNLTRGSVNDFLA